MTPADALRWAVRRAEEAEDRAERWIGWGRPAERAEEVATHAAAVERVKVLREVCDLLGIDPENGESRPTI